MKPEAKEGKRDVRCEMRRNLSFKFTAGDWLSVLDWALLFCECERAEREREMMMREASSSKCRQTEKTLVSHRFEKHRDS